MLAKTQRRRQECSIFGSSETLLDSLILANSVMVPGYSVVWGARDCGGLELWVRGGIIPDMTEGAALYWGNWASRCGYVPVLVSNTTNFARSGASSWSTGGTSVWESHRGEHSTAIGLRKGPYLAVPSHLSCSPLLWICWWRQLRHIVEAPCPSLESGSPFIRDSVNNSYSYMSAWMQVEHSGPEEAEGWVSNRQNPDSWSWC